MFDIFDDLIPDDIILDDIIPDDFVFDNVVNFFRDNWSVLEPVVDVLFPTYGSLIDLVEVAEPLTDLIIDTLFSLDENDLSSQQIIQIEPESLSISVDSDFLNGYQTRMDTSIDSSKLFLLTNEPDYLAPTGLGLVPPPTGEVLSEWTADNPGGILALDGDDFLIASVEMDVINGNQGSDTVGGSDGDDVIRGGKGNDALGGDSGNDLINGNRDSDRIWGGEGDDIIRGGKGNDSLYGGPGQDLIIGDLGVDVLTGDEDADRFVLAGTNADADVVADLTPEDGDRILIVANFGVENITVTSFDSSNLTSNLPVDISNIQGTLIQEAGTGNVLGIVTDITDTEQVRNAIVFVNPDDPLLMLG
ncbi:MAG: calcium-binding protein [Cyanobacteriota bacterium]|nr:calcium-binding protein [Cyanobacteriota bacterium]